MWLSLFLALALGHALFFAVALARRPGGGLRYWVVLQLRALRSGARRQCVQAPRVIPQERVRNFPCDVGSLKRVFAQIVELAFAGLILRIEQLVRTKGAK